jgi:hypothetical protein
MTCEEKKQKDQQTADAYNKLIEEWKPFEKLIHSQEQKKYVRIVENKPIEEEEAENFELQIDEQKQKKANNIEPSSNDVNKIKISKGFLRNDSSVSNEVFIEDSSANAASANSSTSPFSMLNRFSAKLLFSRLMQRKEDNKATKENMLNTTIDETLDQREEEEVYLEAAKKLVDEVIQKSQRIYKEEEKQQHEALKSNEMANRKPNLKSRESSLSEYTDTKNALTNTTTSSIDDIYHDVESESEHRNKEKADDSITIKGSNSNINQIKPDEDDDQLPKLHVLNQKSIENHELVEAFSLNMNRIDKDVSRCDRNYWYFMSNEHLQKLKNIMYT